MILIPLLQPHLHGIRKLRVPLTAPVQVLALALHARVVHVVLVGEFLGVGGGVGREAVVPGYRREGFGVAGEVVGRDGGVLWGGGGVVLG